jgi:hypothetical protein
VAAHYVWIRPITSPSMIHMDGKVSLSCENRERCTDFSVMLSHFYSDF